MKAIMIMFDSLNRNMLPPYGCGEVYAPNFQRLAKRSVTFDCCYAGSLPCMPARRELHTGRINFLHRSWGPLEPFDDSMPEILKRSGIHTHLVSDHLHYWEDGGATYHQRYSTWEMIRGQEADHWKPDVDPEPPPEHLGRYFTRDYVNRKYMDSEEKQPQTRTFDGGLEFLRSNREKDNWFLQIETFDPHEPFYSMENYKKLYPHDYEGPHFDWPDYKEADESLAQITHVRKEYQALLSMCDANLGKILDEMDTCNMWEDTMLIVNTDHGFLLSEHGWWGKCIMPYYDEIARIPLFIHDPRTDREGVRCSQLVQTIDLCPTLLTYFERPVPHTVEGQDLRAAVEEGRPVREAALFGQHGVQVNVTDGRYVYMRACVTPDNRPLYQYTLMPAHTSSFFRGEELMTAQLENPFSFTKGCPVLKTDSALLDARASILQYGTPEQAKKSGGKKAEIYKHMLFDTLEDPHQEHPITDPVLEERMCRILVKKMQENDAPREQYVRLGLTGWLEERMESGILTAARRTEKEWGTLTWFADDQAVPGIGITMGECVIRQGKSNSVHFHPNCTEVLHVIGGRIRHTLGEEETIMEEGDTIVIPAGVTHHACNLGDGDARMMISYSSGHRVTL